MADPYLLAPSGVLHRRAGCPHSTKAARDDRSELVSADTAVARLEHDGGRLCGSCAEWDPFVESLRQAARRGQEARR